MKVLIDMNLSTDWVEMLVADGHDAVHWSAIGEPAVGDDELIAWAIGTGAVILTSDLDFGIEIVTQDLSAPGVVQLRSDELMPTTFGTAVLDAMRDHASDLDRGALVTVEPKRSRIRLLGLGPRR